MNMIAVMVGMYALYISISKGLTQTTIFCVRMSHIFIALKRKKKKASCPEQVNKFRRDQLVLTENSHGKVI